MLRNSPTPPRTSSRPRRASAPTRSAVEAIAAQPISPSEFAALIGRLGPFEHEPRIAVAVSGGPDSLALCLLAQGWAQAHGGVLQAFTVDHGLRPDSGAEAVTVGRWLAERAISHEVLPWTGDKPASGVQAAAREARYALLALRCRERGILHLLLGHQQDDQAETVALRLGRGSGPDGQAGMAPVRELMALRLLRPLLPVPKARLMATLEAYRQPWLEDPGNRAPACARGHLRQDGMLDRERLVARAAGCAHARAERDRAVAVWFAGAARIDPAGYVVFARSALRDAPPEVARRALLQALLTVGGHTYRPREERLERLLQALLHEHGFPGRTLGGCRIVIGRNGILICREAGAIRQQIAPPPGVFQMWDRRFAVRLRGAATDLVLRALGETGWRVRRRLASSGEAAAVPPEAGPSLPALWQGERLIAVPHLGLRALDLPDDVRLQVRFRPAWPLAGAAFACP